MARRRKILMSRYDVLSERPDLGQARNKPRSGDDPFAPRILSLPGLDCATEHLDSRSGSRATTAF